LKQKILTQKIVGVPEVDIVCIGAKTVAFLSEHLQNILCRFFKIIILNGYRSKEFGFIYRKLIFLSQKAWFKIFDLRFFFINQWLRGWNLSAYSFGVAKIIVKSWIFIRSVTLTETMSWCHTDLGETVSAGLVRS
jgi:hypothetical protein